ncbi:hypothetical protein [Micromonospora aurantiaca (nom. illeg.)]|uniref:hypothetical protein n=1 Tax=Micromonospora aurantiaca (nom. illeg.) TaxID=47850 RepID=UPI000828E055|nr:hypothetical protein [Micromonospora aurantiaca]SCL33473.1 hypothetical protein GA0070615_2296 [Micromonospora aurantiaca]
MADELTVPFSVTMASYCIEFHGRNRCRTCTDDGCVRLADANQVIDQFRALRLERYRLSRRT